ncbi:MAG TPA: tetratricopeptide repeat protein, partial [Gemmataceae bacterium]|nr:tetratricopeptide repeat protein [Gemmataceae bacterium]
EALILEAMVVGCWQSNLTTDAYRWATIWTERHPDDWYATFWYGRILESALLDTQAEEAYRKVLAKKPDLAVVHLLLGQVLMRKGSYAEAKPHFQARLQDDPDNAAALTGLAQCQRTLDPADVARSTLDRLFASHPDYGPGLLLRGQLELADDRPKEALAWLRRAYAVAPEDAPTNKSLATALRLLEKEAEAQQYESRGQEIDKDSRRLREITKELLSHPDDVALRCEAGTIFLRLNRTGEALHWLLSALLLDPNYQPAKKPLADCLHQLGDPKLEASYRSVLAGRETADSQNQP